MCQALWTGKPIILQSSIQLSVVKPKPNLYYNRPSEENITRSLEQANCS